MIFIHSAASDAGFILTGLSNTGLDAFVRVMRIGENVSAHTGDIIVAMSKKHGSMNGCERYYDPANRTVTIPGIPADGSVEQLMARVAIWKASGLRNRLKPRHINLDALCCDDQPWSSGARLAAWQLGHLVTYQGGLDRRDLQALAAWHEADRHEMVIERTTGTAISEPIVDSTAFERISEAAARLRAMELGVSIKRLSTTPPDSWSMTTAMTLTPQLIGAMP